MKLEADFEFRENPAMTENVHEQNWGEFITEMQVVKRMETETVVMEMEWDMESAARNLEWEIWNR
jgi:hypothetical protein